jgi:hypothetical protein
MSLNIDDGLISLWLNQSHKRSVTLSKKSTLEKDQTEVSSIAAMYLGAPS